LQLRKLGQRAALLVGASAAASLLALTAAGAASATTLGGTPQPTAPPTILYTPPTTHTPPPVVRHHPPKPVRQCFYSWETETDVITLAGQNPEPYGQPTEQYGQPTGDPSGYGQPNGHPANTETVHVTQLVRVCVTGAKVDSVTDVSSPEAWVTVPTPSGNPPITDRYVTAS
jgi:hypothetical protein